MNSALASTMDKNELYKKIYGSHSLNFKKTPKRNICNVPKRNVLFQNTFAVGMSTYSFNHFLEFIYAFDTQINSTEK